MTVEPLSPSEESVWRLLVRLLIVLPRSMDEDLQRRTGMSMTSYVVLMSLSEAKDNQLRMSDLARRAALSPSRMTRVVTEMEHADLVVRLRSPEDSRSNLARLTAAGRARLVAAWPEHLASVRSLVFDHLTADQVRDIGAIAGTLMASIESPAQSG